MPVDAPSADRDLARAKERLASLRREIRTAALERSGPDQAEALRPLVRAELTSLIDLREALRRWLVARME